MIINDVPIIADLVDVLTELRSQLRLNGSTLLKDIRELPDDVMITCPYHKGGEERRPSAGLRKSDGTFHCFTCGETHSLQEMISHCFGRYDDLAGSFGWSWILKNFATVQVESRKDIDLDFVRGKEKKVDYVPDAELDEYRYYHPYWARRKIISEDLIELFDLGYDAKTQCITFPVRDESGNCLFVARRSVKSKMFNYPKGVEKPVYGLYEYKVSRQKLGNTIFGWGRAGGKTKFLHDINSVIICESMIDALTCWQYGRYAVALNGLGTAYQYEQLSRMDCREFILATDMDEAGKKARAGLKKNIKNHIITEMKWDPKIAKDINDMSEEYFNSLAILF